MTRHLTWVAAAIAGLLLLGGGGALRAQSAPPHAYVGAWRVTATAVAPWALADSAHLDRTRLLNRTVRLGAASMSGLPPFDCTGARIERTRTPADGMFQGNLPAPAATAARALGFATGPAPGIRVTCATGLFEFHAVSATRLLIALDNVILTLERTASSPRR